MDTQDSPRIRQASWKEHLRELEWLVNLGVVPDLGQLIRRFPLLHLSLVANDGVRPDLLALRDEVQRAWAGGPDAGEIVTRLLHLNEPHPKAALPKEGSFYRRLVANWQAGEVRVRGYDAFENAIYHLLKHSHLAKVCAAKWDECQRRYFIAERGNQIYCSDSCADSMKRTRALKWWDKKGKQRRKTKQKSKRQAKRKGRNP